MTESQEEKLRAFLAEAGVSEEDLEATLYSWRSERINRENEEKLAQVLSLKKSLKGRCFKRDKVYIKVISYEAYRVNYVTCLYFCAEPYFDRLLEYIDINNIIWTQETEAKILAEKDDYEEITCAEYEEAFMNWAQKVLTLEYKEGDAKHEYLD